MCRGGLLLAVILGWCTALSAQAAEPAGWLHSFEEAEAQAKRLQRPLLIHFSADWCAPCRRMEREVFRSSEFLRQLGGNFVAVKVDADQRPDLVQRFSVRGLPTDLFLDPGGRILSQTTGYQDRDDYLGQMARIEAKFNLAGNTQIARSQKPAVTAPAVRQLPKTSEPAPAAKDTKAAVGLGGFSPVSLWNWREWRKGQPEFAADYQSVTFHMATADELRQFRANPEQYVPRLRGCDPVLMAETERAVPGSTKFGAYFDGELYLFASSETRQRFKQSPRRFITTHHVRKTDESEPTQLR